MAKKKRKDEKEEEKYEWTPPDFDEKDFLEKDIRGTKALFIASLLGVLLGVVAYFTTSISFYLGIILIFLGMLTLRFVYPMVKVEVSQLDKKNIAGNYILLFFLALGIWIILLNPPFSDLESPQVMSQKTWYTHNNQTLLYTGTPITEGDLTNITVVVRDNGNIVSVQIEIHASELSPGTYVDMTQVGGYGHYEYKDNYTVIGSSINTQYIFTIKVTDGVGHVTTSQGSFTVTKAA